MSLFASILSFDVANADEEKSGEDPSLIQAFALEELLGDWYRWRDLGSKDSSGDRVEVSPLRWTFVKASADLIVMVTRSIYNEKRGDFAVIEETEGKLVLHYYRQTRTRQFELEPKYYLDQSASKRNCLVWREPRGSGIRIVTEGKGGDRKVRWQSWDSRNRKWVNEGLPFRRDSHE
jgi:hypothetical protein